MARPQFKNSKIRIMSSMSDSEQIGASFWFIIDDQELQTQLEKYYALSGKNPSMQFQRKLGEGNYQTTASANLFLPDERIAELKADASTKAPATEAADDGTDFNFKDEGESNGFPTSK